MACTQNKFFRPPDIVVGGLIFYQGFFFISFFFFLSSFYRQLLSAVAEPNSTKIGHMLGSNCDLKTHVQNLGYPLTLQIGDPKTTFFWTTSQLNGNFTGLYLRNETRYRQSVKCVDNYKGLLHRPKMSWTLVYKQLKTRPAFLPTTVNSAFSFIARLRRRRSANGTQPHFAKRWTVGRTNQLP